MELITSTQNQHVKAWRKLATKKGRLATKQYLIEGWHLVQEALTSRQAVLAVMATDAAWAQYAPSLESKISQYRLTDNVVQTLAETQTSQGIFAILALPEADPVTPATATGVWLFLDGVQDPGNIGTMVRTADAAGLTGVVFGKGTASAFSPKNQRAMQGSQFHVHLIEGDLHSWVAGFQSRQLPVYGTNLDPQAKRYNTVAPISAGAIIMGNEGNGMAPDLQAATTANLYIPIRGQAESLNVAVAAGIVMFALVSDD